jgi:hypothetical protein
MLEKAPFNLERKDKKNSNSKWVLVLVDVVVHIEFVLKQQQQQRFVYLLIDTKWFFVWW